MSEEVFRFGPAEKLMGILSRPSESLGDAPVALMLNAGIVHRVGPFRLHVDLARTLAEQGYASLRLDLSGLGDSEVRTELADGEDRFALDVADAMNALHEAIGVQAFVPIGLCSGAYNSHQVLIANERAAGGVFLDGIVYETDGHRRRKWQRRLRYRFLRNAIKKRVSLDRALLAEPDEIDAAEFFTNDQSADEIASEIESMLERQQQLLFLYTEGYRDISSAEQFQEMFGIEPDGQQLQVDYYSNFEHTLRLTRHRRVIVNRIAEWFSERFPHSGLTTAECQSRATSASM